MYSALFWIRASHPNCKPKFQVIFAGSKEIVSSDAFGRIIKDAKFLKYPIVCLN